MWNFFQLNALLQDFDPLMLFPVDYFTCMWNNGPYTYTISYRPNIPVELVTTQLGFPTLDAWYDFSKELPIVYSDDSKAQIDCKASTANLTAWWIRWLLVYSPVQVSHLIRGSLIDNKLQIFPLKTSQSSTEAVVKFGYKWDTISIRSPMKLFFDYRFAAMFEGIWAEFWWSIYMKAFTEIPLLHPYMTFARFYSKRIACIYLIQSLFSFCVILEKCRRSFSSLLPRPTAFFA